MKLDYQLEELTPISSRAKFWMYGKDEAGKQVNFGEGEPLFEVFFSLESEETPHVAAVQMGYKLANGDFVPTKNLISREEYIARVHSVCYTLVDRATGDNLGKEMTLNENMPINYIGKNRHPKSFKLVSVHPAIKFSGKSIQMNLRVKV